MNINEALKLAKERAKGFNEEPIETEESFLFVWNFDENDTANIDSPIIRVDKKSGKVKFIRYLDLSDLELNKMTEGEI